MHAYAPAVEDRGFFRPGFFDWLTIPRGRQRGDGAQLGAIGHAVAAYELPPFSAVDPIQRLTKIETTLQTFDCEVGGHEESIERLFRFGPEFFELLSMRFRASFTRIFELFFEGLGLGFPHPMAHLEAPILYLFTGVQLLFTLLLRGESQIVDGGLAFARHSYEPEPTAHWPYLPGWQLDVNVR